ncbi:non-ribosomal peptide synthetase component F [Kitasatospora sp. MAP12-15]|uniref:AMP-binding protein n=1 Tax=unclassified Kitasatospora TaxID=2633591 RepID=UPI002476311A|nr:AMP-binding protein [Kitasatospora sp. MAP12-44]MDH6108448.1 non-ribosomal peptide synthetase component F [Kitasatospora sp. MAP12-44]
MTSRTTPGGRPVAAPVAGHDLSPFQRATLAYPHRRFHAVVERRGAGAGDLLPAVLAALEAMPVLRCALLDRPGAREGRQQPQPSRHQLSPDGRGWRLTAGTLEVSVADLADGARLRLEVSGDPLFADRATVGLLLADIESRLAGRTGRTGRTGRWGDFFAVAARHRALLDAERLLAPERHGRTPRTQSTPSPALTALGLDGLTARGEGVRVEHRVAGPGADAFARLALEALLRRLTDDAPPLAELVDIRGLLGPVRQATPGPLTQAVPHVAGPRLEASARSELARRAREAAAGRPSVLRPALAEGSAVPLFLLDQGELAVPPGWQLLRWSELRAGAVLLRSVADPGGLRLSAESTNARTAVALRTLLAMWAALLTDMVAHPDRPLQLLSVLPSSELDSLATQLTTLREPAEDLCTRLARLADQDPAAPALRDGRQTLSRSDLLGRVGALAHELGGGAAGQVVAVLARPGAGLLAGYLAAMWRGAAFLPLSPDEPPAELAEAIRRSGATVLFAGPDAPHVAVPGRTAIVALDGGAAAQDPGRPTPVPARAAACLLRTPGASGGPEFVRIPRAGLDNHLRWAAEEILADHPPFPVLASALCDASLKQLLGPLYAGGATWVPTARPHERAAMVAELSTATGPLVLNCLPSYWSELLHEAEAQAPPLALSGVARLLLGGEAPGRALLQRTRQALPAAQIWNLYGPTEATGTASMGLLLPGQETHVGHGVAGAHVVVADALGNPLPPGVHGEVWLTGPGLSPGYLHPAADGAAFAELRLGQARVSAYRSGDLGVIGRSGQLQLDGRLDTRLEVSGRWIEPAGIEQLTEGLKGVRDALVVTDDRGREGVLRVFVVGEAEPTRVLGQLRQLLPAPLTPASVTVLAAFPRLASGKVDRAALLALTTGALV